MKLYGIILAILISGCSATGVKFVEPTLINKKTATIYFMRQDKFLGAAGCRTVLVNNSDIGCIKNAGFLRVETPPGKRVIKLPKVTETDWANETSVEQDFKSGEIYYYEWTHELEDFYVIPAGALVVTGGKTKASIIKHTEQTALPILKELRNSKNEG
ncbi:MULTISPECIES: DUF2846 domain-containing protein [Pseudoalteromonas]|uniref:DUF2846 domain-containing protein n=1 Tax=Pseudoalteromonas TaxID=53246 RepID=UPI000C34DF33|nr:MULTISPECIES: DUF2846 domain-containing protein [Pseudoalteromonas]MBG9990858.1 DUF2846 domain-containing protein [Pseudoalteromonas sp. NZS37]PKG62860.1 hypothetical protein CXF75_18690 [Pseudoalteromonas arctica]PKG72184.1 hypothetical protein CXF64_01530 [Pseudoalteromonas sp. GutCa3]